MTEAQAIEIINLLQGICGILMICLFVGVCYGLYKFFNMFF